MVRNKLFDGRYRILKVLGVGGTSTVYLGENVNLGTLWAIKEINKSSSSTKDLLVEPNILKKLNHPALPRIFDIIEDDKSIYIVEDYIEGISLDKKLLTKIRFPEKIVVSWAKQICDVLIYLHSLKPNPIIYRDMKPSNIILTSEGKIKLIDFGIAREYKKEALNDTTYIGTRGYAAPEQYGTAQTDVRTDIYSLGITLHHLLTGKSPKEFPFEIKPIREFDENLSIGIEYIIMKCTRLNSKQRYQSVKALLRDLTDLDGFDKTYKSKITINKFKIALMIFILVFFLYITYVGFVEIESFFRY